MLFKNKILPLTKGLFFRAASSEPQKAIKVAVLGASGGIGQPLSLLLRHNPRVSNLSLYDVKLAAGVAADLSHVPSKCVVKGYGPGQIRDALEGADVVILTAGVPRKANQSREDQFNINAKIVKPLASTCSLMAPNAVYGIISNPVNSIVPLFCEMFKEAGVFDQYKIMGITLLDSVRAGTFIAKEKGWDPLEINCPVICGHSGATIVPVLSQCKPDPQLSTEKAKFITMRVKSAGREIVDAKQDTGTVTLSMAWSAHKFTDSVVRALQGEKGIVECAYVKSDVCPELNYFASQVELGVNGISKNLGIPALNPYEKSLLEEAIPKLLTHIAAGEAFANMKVGWW